MQDDITKQNPLWLRAYSNSRTDVWDAQNGNGYDLWYFDAISDDGKEAVRISFLTNDLIASRSRPTELSGTQGKDPFELSPSVTFSFFSEGKIKYSASANLRSEDFIADCETSSCQFGESKFVYGSAEYGVGHSVMLNLPISRNRSIEAHFEWLSVESDLGESHSDDHKANNFWNVVASRSDVTGRISIHGSSNGKKPIEVFHFRGSGYHDHRCGVDPFAESISSWEWGRVHYADATAAFCRYLPQGGDEFYSRLLIVSDGGIRWLDCSVELGQIKRGRYGIKYPEYLVLTAKDNIKLEMRPTNIVACGYIYLAFISDVTLTLPDGVSRNAVGITETVTSRKLRRGWLDRILNFRN